MFWRADTGEDVFEVVADELPYACGVELLRSIERPLLEHGRRGSIPLWPCRNAHTTR